MGGQGVLTAAEIIAQACLLQGFDVKKSELHGMAQRGGSVVTHVRFAQLGSVSAPLPALRTVDLLVGFELIEAVRALDWLSPQADAVLNDLLVFPPSSPSTTSLSREELLDAVKQRARKLVTVDADALARQAGNLRTAGTVIVGAAAPLLPISTENWHRAVQLSIPPGTHSVNLKAFEIGYSHASHA